MGFAINKLLLCQDLDSFQHRGQFKGPGCVAHSCQLTHKWYHVLRVMMLKNSGNTGVFVKSTVSIGIIVVPVYVY